MARGGTASFDLPRLLRRVGGRTALAGLTAVLGSAVPAAAQAPVVLQGRVVEAGAGMGIVSATVELDGHAVIATGRGGAFRFDQVRPGAYGLRVTALGYAPADLFVVVRRDTTLVIPLALAPVRLDTLAVDARRVDVRGHVRDRASRDDLFQADVLTSTDRETQTNLAGRFRLRDMPAGVPVLLAVRAFGYLPVDTMVTAEDDTTLVFLMDVDSLVQKMLDVEVARLEARSRPFRSSIMPALDREELVRRGAGSLLDVIESRYGIHLRRVRCMLIDERQTYNGLEELRLLFPAEVERVEVLERGAMLRIYTRDFARRMLGGGIQLQRPVYVPYGNPPFCR